MSTLGELRSAADQVGLWKKTSKLWARGSRLAAALDQKYGLVGKVRSSAAAFGGMLNTVISR